ncbi:MAG: TrmO family methyltransferase [Verrucomicrobiota bacterium]
MNLTSIGEIHSRYAGVAGIPIQSRYSAGSSGEIVLFPEYSQGLSDLLGFDRIWLVFWCHLGRNPGWGWFHIATRFLADSLPHEIRCGRTPSVFRVCA